MLSVPGYEVLEKIHSSTTTDAYRCKRIQDKQPFILKLPHSEYPTQNEIANLQHEYKLLKALNLPGVIQADELIELAHHPILVLEDIAGISLQTYLAQHPCNLTTFFNIALQLTDIIGALHQKHVIHKDIKPANIIIEPKSLQIKLIDLSISSQLTEENLNYISLNSLEGTLAYMSPEQTGRMNRPLDYRSDFYSMGVTFFEMLIGQPPFNTTDPLEMVHCHIAKTPPLLSELNPQIPAIVASIIARLLAKMPEERYISAIGLKKDLMICVEEWQQQGVIRTFELGQGDLHDHLQISHKLYGREAQVKQLLAGFERVSQQKRCELLLVSGYSGIGKTAVIKEIYKPIVQRHGYFISGKYDQLQRSTPYTAIIAAFQNLVKKVLTLPESDLQHIKQSLAQALGNIGQVIIDLIPEVELIIGKQPPIPPLNPPEAQNRFNLVFQNFVKVFAQSEHPLVIFLDDLQWADNASLTFIENLFVNQESSYLFLIGAYRDNEVQAGHILLDSLHRLQKANVPIETILLQPLQVLDIEDLLSDTFRYEKKKVTELATLLHEKTLGNPLFVCEFLKSLYQQHDLYFSYEHASWQWDMEKLQQANMTHNVVDLLTSQIHKLPENTQHILTLAACIGHTFTLQTLAIISEQSTTAVAQALWQVMQSRFIIALENSHKTELLAEANRFNTALSNSEILYYQFSHDRIQHAAYSLISVNTRQQIHLSIGRLLLKDHLLHENDNQLFTIVDHFNHSISLLTHFNERANLAQYNFWAGQKAKTSAAYKAALAYFNVAQTLLPKESWKNNYTLTYPLYLGLAQCSYLAGEFENAEKYFNETLHNVNGILDKVTIYVLKIEWYTMMGRYYEVAELGLAGLKLLGINLPSNPNTFQILYRLAEIYWKTAFVKIEEIELAPLTEQHKIYVVRLLVAMLPAVYFSNPNLLLIIFCKLITLSLQYGYIDETTFAYMGFGFVLICELNQLEKGFSFVKLANKLLGKIHTLPSRVKSNTTYWTIIHYWKYPANSTLAPLLNEYHLALEAGNLNYAAYNIVVRAMIFYAIGRPLDESLQAAQTALNFLEKTKINESHDHTHCLCLTIQALQDNQSLKVEELKLIENSAENRKTKAEVNQIYLQYVKFYYIMSNYNQALRVAIKNEQYGDYATGQVVNTEGKFFIALSLAANFHLASITTRRNYLKKIKKIQLQFKRWASWCPENFLHYYLLLCAEIAALRNTLKANFSAMKLFDQAVSEADKNGYTHIVAIANERAANFYFKMESPHLAKHYVLEAYHTYQRWGAFAKCKLLEQRYPQLLQSSEKIISSNQHFTLHGTTATAHNQNFDTASALKFTLAISSEIQLDKLLAKLLHIILENAGAERCTLICKQDNQWVIEANGTADKQEIYSPPQLITASSPLPLTLNSYVQRTGESIVIADATHDEKTLSDPYVIKHKPKSMVSFPIYYQGQLRRILYLENNLTTNTFTSQHLQILQILGTQAAVSLENASLYYQATHDLLTGLANRNLLYYTFNYVVSQRAEQSNQLVLIFLDLDYFKTINDTLGHEVGDQLLVYFAQQLKTHLREGDLAVRLGGDEFVIMLNNILHGEAIKIIANKLYEHFAKPVDINGHSIKISSSMGISIYPQDGTTIDSLLKHADLALYQAKEKGKNQYCFYQQNIP